MSTLMLSTYCVSQHDINRLRHVINNFRRTTDRDIEYLESLEMRLENAHIVRPQDMPPDVVTMNTRVRLRDPQSGLSFTYTLVFPSEANAGLDKISVVAPLGAALLGAREQDRIRWVTPSGEREVEVDSILYQPEAMGHYHV